MIAEEISFQDNVKEYVVSAADGVIDLDAASAAAASMKESLSENLASARKALSMLVMLLVVPLRKPVRMLHYMSKQCRTQLEIFPTWVPKW